MNTTKKLPTPAALVRAIKACADASLKGFAPPPAACQWSTRGQWVHLADWPVEGYEVRVDLAQSSFAAYPSKSYTLRGGPFTIGSLGTNELPIACRRFLEGLAAS